jgi:hypothetical protein
MREQTHMTIILGAVLVGLAILLLSFGRPAAGGAFSRFVARPGMGMVASLLFTVLFTSGLGLLISSVLA